ncbi:MULTISPECIES: NMCC_0638 family (lipo)protein [Paraburkholderia]|uniref:NMCC_0638 family (lipo)protein n=1 Tax=Paraburkholderia TaxID=1822464 RepID=UPI0038BCD81E
MISQPDNSCSVWARRADAAASIDQFKRIVLGTQRPGLLVTVLEDRDIEGQGGTYHYLSYLLSKEGRQSGLYASAIASASPTAEVEVRLRLMPAKAE